MMLSASIPVNARSIQRRQRQRSERRGRLAELVAALVLIIKGYRIVARRVASPYGELDLVAVRGRRLAFVEVKYRSRLQAAATSVTSEQSNRIVAAAEHWARRRRAYRDHSFGLDTVYIAPWRWPRHISDALQSG